jgi:hypothetical protein
VSLDALVALHDFFCVDGQPLVWVHHHTEQARVCLEEKNTNISRGIRKESTKSTFILFIYFTYLFIYLFIC